MARFMVFYNENDTVTRILYFMGHTFTYEWNRKNMTGPDFRAQAIQELESVANTHIEAILDNISYYNDDLPTLIGTLTDYEMKMFEKCSAAKDVPP